MLDELELMLLDETELDELLSELEELEALLELAELELEETDNGKVGGFIISPSFAGKSQIERQNMLWDYLDGNLGQDKILRIVSLITITPDEAKEE